MRGDVARARAVPVGRVCTVFSGRGDALVSGVFVLLGACFKEVARPAVLVWDKETLPALYGGWGAHVVRGVLEWELALGAWGLERLGRAHSAFCT